MYVKKTLLEKTLCPDSYRISPQGETLDIILLTTTDTPYERVD